MQTSSRPRSLSRFIRAHVSRCAQHEVTKPRSTRRTYIGFVSSRLRVFVCAAGIPSVRVAALVLLSTMLLSALLLSSVGAQQPAPQRAPGTIAEGVTAVLVDVVVRDRRGQPVRDLTAADFEILEDGVPQTLGSFTPVLHAGPGAAPAAGKPAAPTPGATVGAPAPSNEGPLVTALVFDRLTPEARRLAVQAAQAYLGTNELAPSYFGVF